METTQSVPYLNRLNTVEGTRQKPHLLYVTHGGKKESYIFHYKEENLYFQYRVYSVRKNSVVLMCIYTRNSRSMKCPAKLTIIPKRNDLIYAKMLGGRNRFYVNFAIALNETSYDDWTLESSNEENHSNYCSTQVPFHSRVFKIYTRKRNATSNSGRSQKILQKWSWSNFGKTFSIMPYNYFYENRPS